MYIVNWFVRVLLPSALSIFFVMAVTTTVGNEADSTWNSPYDLSSKIIFGIVFVICLFVGSLNYWRTNGKEGFNPIKNLMIELGIEKEE